MRYIAKESGLGLDWYVYDTLKGQLVWTTRIKVNAEEMVKDLNAIHESSPASGLVPKDVARRVWLMVKSDELLASNYSKKAVACLEAGDGKGADSNGALSREAHQRVEDLQVLLFAALGVPFPE